MTAKTKPSKISVKILGSSGQTTDLDLSSYFSPVDLSGIKPNFLHQILHSYLSNRRQSTAKAKTRCEISGGGRKPWKQKGTGRARQGSIRSPQWRGGGVVFGPTGQQNFKENINQKMKRKALRLALLNCLQENCLIVVEKFDQDIDSTKKMRIWLSGLPIKSNNLLVFSPDVLPLARFADNLDFVRSITDTMVNALDIFQSKTVIISQQSLVNILQRTSQTANQTALKKPTDHSKPSKK